jgi:hypothetical protein
MSLQAITALVVLAAFIIVGGLGYLLDRSADHTEGP